MRSTLIAFAMRLPHLVADMNATCAFECLLLRPGHEIALARFFSDLAASGDNAFFHPHATDVVTLRKIAEQPGRDLYYVFAEDGCLRAYGLLRGWNDGYVNPSLGVAVHPSMRACGLGRLMMDFLEMMARYRGAPAIRLRVHKGNARAIAIYTRRGYEMHADANDPHLLVGIKVLGGKI